MAAQGRNELALAAALKDASIADRDSAGVQLARRYAQLLDGARGAEQEAEVYADLGPKYLATLTALGLTLAGRASKKGGDSGASTGSAALDELRARRVARSG